MGNVIKKKKGFTLSETLVTLSILGIVAVIIAPNLVKNYQETITVQKVKKMYETLDSAHRIAITEKKISHRETFANTNTGRQKVVNIIKPYIKIEQDCGNNTNNKRNCGMNIANYHYLNSKTTDASIPNSGNFYAFRLKNKEFLSFRVYGDSHFAFYYDVNGSKGPNEYGKDLFRFNRGILSNGISIITPGVGTNMEDSFNNSCKDFNTNSKSGLGCASWVVYRGNMNYLKCNTKLTWNMNKCR